MGVTMYEENGFRLSSSRGGITQPGPLIGQHTDYVLSEFLGLASDEIARLHETEALD
jgi:crotonobetainyl-CoA:carnitine CoA-transferase CaiB-like acyl-CoA transferase